MRGLGWTLSGLMLLGIVPAVPIVSAEDLTSQEQVAVTSTLSEEELETQRGGQAISINETTMGAVMQDNTLTSSITGANTISGDAFTGANGFVTVIQNSGNQVIIQDSTIINLTLQ